MTAPQPIEPVPKKINLREHFMALQSQMVTELEVKRDIIGHPGAKGNATEEGWRRWFTKYLPGRYRVDKAFVIDAEGRASDQIDVVIYDSHYTPFLLNEDGAIFVPAESVYAVLEVKQALNATHLAYAGAKAASVRRLRRTSAPIVQASGTSPPRPPIHILAGILAVDSEWKPPLGNSFVGALNKLEADQGLDLGCALKHGAFRIRYAAGKEPHVEVSPPEQALIRFFLDLVARLQSAGTVTAIDFPEYVRALDS